MYVQAVWNFVRHMSEGTEIMFLLFNTRPQDGGWVLWYHMVICVSFCPSICLSYIHPYIFSFPDGNLSKCQCIFTKFGICGLGLLMGKVCQFFTQLFAHDIMGYYCFTFLFMTVNTSCRVLA